MAPTPIKVFLQMKIKNFKNYSLNIFNNSQSIKKTAWFSTSLNNLAAPQMMYSRHSFHFPTRTVYVLLLHPIEIILNLQKYKSKVNFALEQALKAQREIQVKLYIFFTLGARCECVFKPRYFCCLPRSISEHIVQEFGNYKRRS
jgi:hypothetical protein